MSGRGHQTDDIGTPGKRRMPPPHAINRHHPAMSGHSSVSARSKVPNHSAFSRKDGGRGPAALTGHGSVETRGVADVMNQRRDVKTHSVVDHLNSLTAAGEPLAGTRRNVGHDTRTAQQSTSARLQALSSSAGARSPQSEDRAQDSRGSPTSMAQSLLTKLRGDASAGGAALHRESIPSESISSESVDKKNLGTKNDQPQGSPYAFVEVASSDISSQYSPGSVRTPTLSPASTVLDPRKSSGRRQSHQDDYNLTPMSARSAPARHHKKSELVPLRGNDHASHTDRNASYNSVLRRNNSSFGQSSRRNSNVGTPSTMAGTGRSLRGLRDGETAHRPQFGFGEGFTSQESDAGSATADTTPNTTPLSGGLRRLSDRNSSFGQSPGVRSNASGANSGRYKFVFDKRHDRSPSDTNFYEPDQYNSKIPITPQARRTHLVKKRKRTFNLCSCCCPKRKLARKEVRSAQSDLNHHLAFAKEGSPAVRHVGDATAYGSTTASGADTIADYWASAV